MIDQLLEQISLKTANRQGGNKKCFITGAYALLYGAIRPQELEQIMETERRLADDGIPVVPTIEYKTLGEPSDLGFYKGWILQRKAPGDELHQSGVSEEAYNKRMQELTERPQQFFDKFASDWMRITNSGLGIDPSKSSNFFYTPEQIHFIDLNLRSIPTPSSETCFLEASTALFGGGAYYKYQNCRKNQQNVLRKISAAFAKQGADTNLMQETCRNRFPEIAAGAFSSKVPSNQSSHSL